MGFYVKKPIKVEAIQYLREKNIFKCQDFCDKMKYNPDTNEYEIETLEGNHILTKGDYIIKGVKGEFYPCKEDIFLLTYDKIDDERGI